METENSDNTAAAGTVINTSSNIHRTTGLEQFPPFDCSNEMHSIGQRWERYVKRFENFTTAMCIKDDERKRAMLLHYVGEETSDLFETLDNTGITYAEVVSALNNHFMPLINIEFETYQFRMLKQMNSELIEQFYTRLRKSSVLCSFQNTDREIKSQLIIGSTDNKLRRYALKNPGVGLTDLVKMGKTNEVSERHSREIEHHITNNVNAINLNSAIDHSGEFGVNYINKTRDPSKTGKNEHRKQYEQKPEYRKQFEHKTENKKCKNCGGEWHFRGRQQCRANGIQCRSCGKYGHFAKVCLTKKKVNFTPRDSQNWTKKMPTSVATVMEEEPDYRDGKSDCVFLNITEVNNKSVGEGYVKLTICGTPITFLIDSGASVNIISKLEFEKLKPKPTLKPTSKAIFAYGQVVPLATQGQFQTTIKHKHKQIMEQFQVSTKEGLSILSKQTSLDLGLITFMNVVMRSITDYEKHIKENFPNIFDGIGKCKDVQIRLHIDDKIPPIANKHRRIPFHLRKPVERELETLEKADIIEKLPEHTATPWVSPIVVVPKGKNREQIRICVDMREPNKAILRERHLTPTLDELILDLNGAEHFSKLDLKQGYHQLILEEKSRNLTTFTTHAGLYRYKRLSFGINAAAERFQNVIQNIIQHIPRVVNMSDDILVYGHTKQQHDESLTALLKTLSERGITLNKEKCMFGKNKLKFFGHEFSKEGVKVSQEKIKEIQNIKKPENPTELRSLMGMITFCNRYIPSLAELSNPLRKLIKKDTAWEWTKDHDRAFNEILRRLAQDITLSYFDKEADTEIWTDASPCGMAAILIQKAKGKMKILSCASRTLTGAETRYAQIEREALAITWAIEHFELYVRGSPFVVITDHQPLVTLFNNPRSKLSARLERWRLRLLSYEFQVKYRIGKENPADYMSRKPSSTTEHKISSSADEYAYLIAVSDVPNHLSLEEIQKETRKDTFLQEIIQDIRTKFKKKSTESCDSKTYQKFYKIRHELITNFDGSIILKGRKIVIPTSLQDRVINIAHQAHSGIVRTKQLIRTKVWFPDVDSKVEEKVRNCWKCMSVTKINQKMPLQTSELPNMPWEYLHIDHKGPLPSGEYLLVLMDLYSRFPVVEVVKSTRSHENIRKLEEIFALLGTPKQICTDNGAPYNSREFESFVKQNNINHRRVTPNWPQANGSVERFNRNLNKTLQIAFTYRLDWKSEVTKMLKTYRATPHGTTNVSPAELLMNRPINIGLPTLDNEILSPKINMERIQPFDTRKKAYQQKYHDNHFKMAATPQTGDQVMLKQKKNNKLDTWCEPVPYTVTETKGTMITAAKPGKQITRNASQYKKVPTDLKYDMDTTRLGGEMEGDEVETPAQRKKMNQEDGESDQAKGKEKDKVRKNPGMIVRGGHCLRRNIKPPDRLIEEME